MKRKLLLALIACSIAQNSHSSDWRKKLAITAAVTTLTTVAGVAAVAGTFLYKDVSNKLRLLAPIDEVTVKKEYQSISIEDLISNGTTEPSILQRQQQFGNLSHYFDTSSDSLFNMLVKKTGIGKISRHVLALLNEKAEYLNMHEENFSHYYNDLFNGKVADQKINPAVFYDKNAKNNKNNINIDKAFFAYSLTCDKNLLYCIQIILSGWIDFPEAGFGSFIIEKMENYKKQKVNKKTLHSNRDDFDCAFKKYRDLVNELPSSFTDGFGNKGSKKALQENLNELYFNALCNYYCKFLKNKCTIYIDFDRSLINFINNLLLEVTYSLNYLWSIQKHVHQQDINLFKVIKSDTLWAANIIKNNEHKKIYIERIENTFKELKERDSSINDI